MAALLSTLAAPPFQGLLARYRTLSEAHELSNLLLFARSEAIRRGVRVTICRSASSSSANPACDGGSWSQGWVAFLDNVDDVDNRPGVLDHGDLVLRTGEGRPSVFVEPKPTFRDWLTYTPTGRPIGSMGLSNGTFCLISGKSRRDVVVAVTGRVSVSPPTTFTTHASC